MSLIETWCNFGIVFAFGRRMVAVNKNSGFFYNNAVFGESVNKDLYKWSVIASQRERCSFLNDRWSTELLVYPSQMDTQG